MIAQPKARGLKAGDQWTVPLCRAHHRPIFAGSLHSWGDERAWWRMHRIDPLPVAEDMWRETQEARV